MAKIIHTMIRVLDLDESIAFYDQAFGLKQSHRLDFEDFALVYPVSYTHLTLPTMSTTW